MRPPSFEELVDPDVQGEERDRLRRAHEALVAAGPAPELPPRLRTTPIPGRVATLPRRTRRVLPIAAAVAIAAFAAGYVAGGGGEPAFASDYTVEMAGTPAAPAAAARVDVAEAEDGGNHPMRVVVRGLEPGRAYELLLTRGRRVVASCGTFRAARGETEVYLNAPFVGREYGWVVASVGSPRVLLATDDAPRQLDRRSRGRGRGGDARTTTETTTVGTATTATTQDDGRGRGRGRGRGGDESGSGSSGPGSGSGSGSSGSGSDRSGSNSGSG